MRTFQKYFRHNTSLEKIDKYVRLVLKTFDNDDNAEVTYKHQIDFQFVRIRIFDRVLN
jgi:hypothetical protein